MLCERARAQLTPWPCTPITRIMEEDSYCSECKMYEDREKKLQRLKLLRRLEGLEVQEDGGDEKGEDKADVEGEKGEKSEEAEEPVDVDVSKVCAPVASADLLRNKRERGIKRVKWLMLVHGLRYENGELVSLCDEDDY